MSNLLFNFREECDSSSEILQVIDRIALSERVKALQKESLSHLVTFLYFTKPEVVDSSDIDKLLIRVDLIDKGIFNKIMKYLIINLGSLMKKVENLTFQKKLRKK